MATLIRDPDLKGVQTVLLGWFNAGFVIQPKSTQYSPLILMSQWQRTRRHRAARYRWSCVKIAKNWACQSKCPYDRLSRPIASVASCRIAPRTLSWCRILKNDLVFLNLCFSPFISKNLKKLFQLKKPSSHHHHHPGINCPILRPFFKFEFIQRNKKWRYDLTGH